MSRRDNKIADLNKHKRADLHGVAPYLESTFLYGTTSKWWNGWDGTLGSASHVHIHRDGHGTSHSSACAEAIEESPDARIIRAACLDRDEAAIVRDICAHPGQGNDTRAKRLGLTVRTFQRRAQGLRERLRAHRVELHE